jgi:hypothetical protein
MIADIQLVDFKDADGNTFTCMLGGAYSTEPDPRFRDFRQGDRISVGGYKGSDEAVFRRCKIVMWTSTGSSN